MFAFARQIVVDAVNVVFPVAYRTTETDVISAGVVLLRRKLFRRADCSFRTPGYVCIALTIIVVAVLFYGPRAKIQLLYAHKPRVLSRGPDDSVTSRFTLLRLSRINKLSTSVYQYYPYMKSVSAFASFSVGTNQQKTAVTTPWQSVHRCASYRAESDATFVSFEITDQKTISCIHFALFLRDAEQIPFKRRKY